MAIKLYLIVLLTYFVETSSLNSTHANVEKTRSIPTVDALISRLQADQWKPDERACLQATLDLLRGVQNNTMWAVWVWDSMQPPVGSMYGAESYPGNYDQCLQAPWSADSSHPGLRSKYCLVQVKSPGVDQTRKLGPYDDAADYYKTPTIDGRVFNQHSLGVCLPSICSASSVARLAQHLLHMTHLPGEVTVDPRDCEVAGEELQYPAGYYGFWAVVAMLVAITIYSSLTSKIHADQTVLGLLAKSFCIKRNYNNLFKLSRDEVKVMHGMRFLTMAIIVCLHEALYLLKCPVSNGLDINKSFRTALGKSQLHLAILVDTFFAMSGLLIFRGLLLGRQQNVICTLLKRYIRLIGPFALCILYMTTTVMYTNHGPYWKILNREETEFCQENWWRSILMINTDVKTLCLVTTWYISCDFQLAILATFLFFVYKKNRRLGLAIFLIVSVGLTAHLGFNVYWRRLDILPFNYKVLSQPRNATDLNYTYTSSHSRAGSYLVGMVMGYIITTYKPADYRNVITKKWSIVIAALSLLVMHTVVGLGIIFMGRSYAPLEAAVVVATNRLLWAISVCSIIGVCEYGDLPIIPGLLSWSGFVPLSKLSYCLYLLHPLLIQGYQYTARGGAYYRIYNTMIHSCGVIVVGSLTSLALHLILEAPLIKISNEVFSDKLKPLDENGHSTISNGGSVTQNRIKNVEKTKLS